jgi:hypothetical protein
MTFVRIRHCNRCAADTKQQVSKLIAVNGAAHFGWFCSTHGGWALAKGGKRWIAHDLLREQGLNIDDLPLATPGHPDLFSPPGHR